MKLRKKVYVGLSVDIIHEGHINILRTASRYGEVIVGLLTDEAIASYKNIPYLDYNRRKIIVQNIKYVKKVIPQYTLSYVSNLNLIKPHYVVHGDDWKKGVQKQTRQDVIKALKKWSGKLIETKYTKNITSTLKKNKNLEFDGMWSSSLTDSATKGLPDNSSLSFSARISSLNDMMDVTTKPVVFDADNGGQIEHLPYLIRSLERSGVSAIIMEDKIGLKKNSLFKNQTGTKQDKPNLFANKIKKICKTRQSNEFMVIASIESFILGKGLRDAVKRAEIYSKAGADAILIHSKEKTPSQIFSFAKKFTKSKYYKPLVSVPSTYSKVYEKDLIKHGFKLVIYANQLLRAAYPAMQDSARTILKYSRALEADKKIIPIKEIISLIKND